MDRIANSTTATPKNLRSIQAIKADDRDAAEAITTLVDKHGFTEKELQDHLALFFLYEHFDAKDSWEGRFKISKRKARQLVKALRACADRVESAISPPYRFILESGLPVAQQGHLWDPIRRTADFFDLFLNETDGRRVDWSEVPKRKLTQLVWRRTRKPNDKHVSALINAMLPDTYDVETHRKFRRKYCTLNDTDSLVASFEEPETNGPKNV